jgi:hypothetical protein
MWIETIKSLGFPISSTFALSAVVYLIARFFADKIYIPLQEKHFKLVEKLEANLDRTAANNEKIVSLLDHIERRFEELESRIITIEQKVS